MAPKSRAGASPPKCPSPRRSRTSSRGGTRPSSGRAATSPSTRSVPPASSSTTSPNLHRPPPPSPSLPVRHPPDPAAGIVGDEQRPVRHRQHSHRPSPAGAVAQLPPCDEVLDGDRLAVLHL